MTGLAPKSKFTRLMPNLPCLGGVFLSRLIWDKIWHMSNSANKGLGFGYNENRSNLFASMQCKTLENDEIKMVCCLHAFHLFELLYKGIFFVKVHSTSAQYCLYEDFIACHFAVTYFTD